MTRGLVRSCHDLSDAGLWAALAESCIGGGSGRARFPGCASPCRGGWAGAGEAPFLRDSVPAACEHPQGSPAPMGASHAREPHSAASERRPPRRAIRVEAGGREVARIGLEEIRAAWSGQARMMGRRPRVCIIAGLGHQCGRRSSARPSAWPAAVVLSRAREGPHRGSCARLSPFQILAFPGGFSFGDHLGSGKVFSTLFKRNLGPAMSGFVSRGGLVIGVCNGFQVLVKMGVLPEHVGLRHAGGIAHPQRFGQVRGSVGAGPVR